ncbi:MAG: eIF2B alpha/beta/delta subunit family protein, partial [Planctomycetota bacterium]
MSRERADRIVHEIKHDRKRGATALAERALDAMGQSRGAADRLIRARPSMPVIAAAVRLARGKGVAAARAELRGGVRKIVRHAKKYLPAGARYIAHSRSGTIDAVLKALRAKRVTKLPADVALVGADALYPGGDFVNAKGSAAFARKARKAGAAVFVVASKLKRVRREIPLERGFERVPGRVVHAFLTE